jgi:hypothetical protein
MTNLADQIEMTGVRDQVDITSVTGKANITNSETNMRDITNILDICYKYCYSDSRKLCAVMKGGGLVL